MRKPFALLGLGILGIFFALFLVAGAGFLRAHANSTIFIFLRDLKLGDSDSDVMQLQKALNRDPETIVAQTGNGSPGFETSFFGPATKSAVIRFQTKYADQVLRPAGQTAASGFVDLWTRLKLNEILLNVSVPTTPTSTVPISSNMQMTQTQSQVSQGQLNRLLGGLNSQSQNTGGGQNNFSALGAFAATSDLLISNPSTNAASVGTTVTLAGYGFSPNANTVNFGNERVQDTNRNANQITFVVPNVATGRYDVSVTPASGPNAGKTSGPIPFMVTVAGAAAPVIEKIDPAVAQFGQKITISGRNFAPTGNTVVTSLGPINNLSSADGKTIELPIPLPDYLNINIPQVRKMWFGTRDNLNWHMHARVVNQFGISAESSADIFTLNI